MALFLSKDRDEMKKCPYCHCNVTTSKYQVHLNGCQSQTRGVDPDGQEIMICPYNQSHRFPEKTLKFHIPNCPDFKRHMLEKSTLAQAQATTTGATSGTSASDYTPCPAHLPIQPSKKTTADEEDPWAAEGAREGVKKFSLINQEEDLEDYINNHPIDQPIDSLKLQRMTGEQKNRLYKIRNKKIQEAKTSESSKPSVSSPPSTVKPTEVTHRQRYDPYTATGNRFQPAPIASRSSRNAVGVSLQSALGEEPVLPPQQETRTFNLGGIGRGRPIGQ